MKIIAKGIANISSQDEILDVFFPCIQFGDNEVFCEINNIDKKFQKLVEIAWNEEDLYKPIESVADAYLKLHLISYKFVLPNTLNLENLFKFLKVIVHQSKWDVILFSPGGESFDQFKDYSHRGKVFNNYIKKFKI